jgi:hypothetical protein
MRGHAVGTRPWAPSDCLGEKIGLHHRKRRVLGLAVLVLLLGASVWVVTHRSKPAPRVSEVEARACLDRIVAAAQAAHDVEGLCAFNHAAANCRTILGYVGGVTSVPRDPPTVVSARYDPKRGEEGDGMVLTVEGIDGRVGTNGAVTSPDPPSRP